MVRSGIGRVIAASATGALMLAAHVALGQADVGAKPPSMPTHTMTQDEADREFQRLDKEIRAAFAAKEYAKAEGLLREQVPLDHENFVPWYNLACALSHQNKLDESLKMLQQAIARGFSNSVQLFRDPDLAGLRASPGFARLKSDWSRSVAAQSEARIARLRERYPGAEKGGVYAFERDEKRGLVFLSAFDAALFEQAKRELDQLSAWWEREVSPAPQAGEASRTPAMVTVLLPTRADYRQWAQKRFGEGWERVGGAYVHDERALVSMDLGATLRHEFWHVLHWRDMESRGQIHPIWIMEGLCSVPEDVEAGARGEMIVKASWRTNIVRRLARASNLTGWDVMFAMDQKRFVGLRPLAFYAQGRAIFMWLHQTGRLREWYGAYCDQFEEDSTGRAAFERVFKKPLKDVEREFKVWARGLPEVQEEVGRGPANLPVNVDPGNGDGVVVSNVELSAVFDRNSPASAGSGLRGGDVISAIDGKPVRDFNDLARVLGEYQAGARVEVSVRRRGKGMTVSVSLVPPRE